MSKTYRRVPRSPDILRKGSAHKNQKRKTGRERWKIEDEMISEMGQFTPRSRAEQSTP